MARSHTWVVITLLCLGSLDAVHAGGHSKVPAPASPGATAPATPPTAAGPAAPAPPAPSTPPPASGLEPPPAGAKADQIADYATALFKQQRYSDAGDALQLAYQREPRHIFLLNVGQTYL